MSRCKCGASILSLAVQCIDCLKKQLDAGGQGYHLAQIPRGEFGEASKIVEEALELQDADCQGVRVMALVELADLVGAIDGYLEKHHPGYTLADLQKMTAVTKRAFVNGHRTSRTP
jgi:hypothetical protein